MIVKARPLKALCEHQGRPLPDEILSDCWNDVDETEFACKEKERIMMKLKPPGYENAIDTDRLIPKNRRGDYKLKKLDANGQAFEDADQDDYLMKEALRQEANRKPRNALILNLRDQIIHRILRVTIISSVLYFFSKIRILKEFC